MTAESILAPVAALSLPDAAGLTDRAQRALKFIEAFEIACAEDYGMAADELKAIKAKSKTLEDQRTGITGPINTALKAINNLFRGPTELLDEAERALKAKMIAWDQEQRRIADEARRKAEADAEAERQRLAAEAAQRQREAQEQAAAAAAAAAAGDAQAAAVATAQAERAHAESAAVAAAAQMVVAAAPAEQPKVRGISTSTKVEFKVEDLHALVRHIAATPELINLLVADEVKLRAYVRGLGSACNLPGVRVYTSQTLSARAA
jgi:hypothetical protein